MPFTLALPKLPRCCLPVAVLALAARCCLAVLARPAIIRYYSMQLPDVSDSDDNSDAVAEPGGGVLALYQPGAAAPPGKQQTLADATSGFMLALVRNGFVTGADFKKRTSRPANWRS